MAFLLLLLPVSGLAGFGIFGWWLHSQAELRCPPTEDDLLDNYQGDYLSKGEL